MWARQWQNEGTGDKGEGSSEQQPEMGTTPAQKPAVEENKLKDTEKDWGFGGGTPEDSWEPSTGLRVL